MSNRAIVLEVEGVAKTLAQRSMECSATKHYYTSQRSKHYSSKVHIELLKLEREALDREIERLLSEDYLRRNFRIQRKREVNKNSSENDNTL